MVQEATGHIPADMMSALWGETLNTRAKRKMRLPFLTLLAVLMLPCAALPQTPPIGSSQSSGPYAIDSQTPQGLQELLRYTGDFLPLVSAHRGGPRQGFPENCLATFENTLQHTFAIMEIDSRYTRDGAIVLHHDPTLERTTTGKGLVAERTLKELKELRLRDTRGIVTRYQIPTLDEALRWARGKTILVLDQKDVSTEARVRAIQQHRAEAYAILIVYSFKDAQACYKLNKNVMMEVMIPNRARFHEFEKTGIPWSNVVAFVGHTPPKDKQLLKMLHEKRVLCIAGTSRNLDRKLTVNRARGTSAIEEEYRVLLQRGVDLIETDAPREVGKLLYSKSTAPASKSRFFHSP